MFRKQTARAIQPATEDREMKRQVLAAAAVVAILSMPTLAKAPANIADLVGARAAGAETQMEARGYQNVGKNNWWDGSNCVHVRVSQGRYKAIDSLKPSACGQGSGAATATCPADVSEADRYKYPACN